MTNQEEHTILTVKSNLLNSTLCDYSDAYMLVKGTITPNWAAADADANNDANKQVMLKIVLHLLIA